MKFKPHFPERLKLDCDAYREFLSSYFNLVLSADGYKNNLSSKIAGEKDSTAIITAKSNGIFAGADEITFMVETFTDLDLKLLVVDGDKFKKGDQLLILCGTTSDILSFERTLLNTLSRLCGIASKSSEFSKILSEFENPVLILLTRKCLLSFLDKKAGVVGGALTHRLMLSDSLMIKENHILSNSLTTLLPSLLESDLSKLDFIEIEVETEEEARQVLEFYRSNDLGVPTGIMFDNFEPDKLRALLMALEEDSLIDNTFTEASGGINLKNLKSYDMPNLDYVSSGDITMNPYATDLSLNFERK